METAFGGKEPERKVVITNDDMAEILNEISLEATGPSISLCSDVRTLHLKK